MKSFLILLLFSVCLTVSSQNTDSSATETPLAQPVLMGIAAFVESDTINGKGTEYRMNKRKTDYGYSKPELKLKDKKEVGIEKREGFMRKPELKKVAVDTINIEVEN